MPAGLRERKKAETYAAIRRSALELFRLQGYAATTTEQIAAAADVSPSTVFRYFPSKEDLVLHDDLDTALVAAFQRQPAEAGMIEAFRGAIEVTLGRLTPCEADERWERMALARSEPELQAGLLAQFARRIQVLAEAAAQRAGCDRAGFAVRNLAGVLLGISVSALGALVDDPTQDFLELYDRGLAHLQAGLPV